MTNLLTEKRDGVAILTLADPDRRNALNLDMVAEIGAALDDAEADDAVGAVVVTGQPPAFCAGADLSHIGDFEREGLKAVYEGFLRFARCPLPTIAAVNGAAVGAGVNLALVCDVRLAGERARFDSRFLDLGLHPGGGHTWMMRRLIGPQGAMAAVVFGQILDGAEAERIGLAWKCVPDGELLDVAVAMAARAASGPGELVPKIKASIGAMADVVDHQEAVEAELTPQVWSLHQPEFADRLAALKARVSSKS